MASLLLCSVPVTPDKIAADTERDTAAPNAAAVPCSSIPSRNASNKAANSRIPQTVRKVFPGALICCFTASRIFLRTPLGVHPETPSDKSASPSTPLLSSGIRGISASIPLRFNCSSAAFSMSSAEAVGAKKQRSKTAAANAANFLIFLTSSPIHQRQRKLQKLPKQRERQQEDRHLPRQVDLGSDG